MTIVGVIEFEATVVDFDALPLILFIPGASEYLNDVFAKTSNFHPLNLQQIILIHN